MIIDHNFHAMIVVIICEILVLMDKIFHTYSDLIFVTDITDYIRGEKSVMCRNFRFL